MLLSILFAASLAASLPRLGGCALCRQTMEGSRPQSSSRTAGSRDDHSASRGRSGTWMVSASLRDHKCLSVSLSLSVPVGAHLSVRTLCSCALFARSRSVHLACVRRIVSLCASALDAFTTSSLCVSPLYTFTATSSSSPSPSLPPSLSLSLSFSTLSLCRLSLNLALSPIRLVSSHKISSDPGRISVPMPPNDAASHGASNRPAHGRPHPVTYQCDSASFRPFQVPVSARLHLRFFGALFFFSFFLAIFRFFLPF